MQTTEQPISNPTMLTLAHYGILTVSGILLAFVFICYWCQFDFCSAVTVYPPWCWALAGILMACLAVLRRTRLIAAALIGLWLAFLIVFADSPGSMIRAWRPRPNLHDTLRIISLNCASSAKAAQEVIALNPDIVLFQESPSRKELVAIGEKLYGPGSHVCWGVDASIVARGEVAVVDSPLSQRGNFVHARVKICDTSIDVVSLRLIPNMVRMDLWSLQCWNAFRENRQQRRQQFNKIMAYLHALPDDLKVVIGGDFNAPPRDAVFESMRPRFTDSFTVAGRGWGGTIINHWPMIRIDQIWTTSQLEAIAATALQTAFSDHRMVVSDFSLEGQHR